MCCMFIDASQIYTPYKMSSPRSVPSAPPSLVYHPRPSELPPPQILVVIRGLIKRTKNGCTKSRRLGPHEGRIPFGFSVLFCFRLSPLHPKFQKLFIPFPRTAVVGTNVGVMFDHFSRARIGRKFPTMIEGLRVSKKSVGPRFTNERRIKKTHILCESRRIVNEKQHRTFSSAFSLSGFASPDNAVTSRGFWSTQLVKMAFCDWSKAMAPNFSQ